MRQLPIERRRGGWFVIDPVGGSSGPWETEDSANAARLGNYEKAHALDRISRSKALTTATTGEAKP